MREPTRGALRDSPDLREPPPEIHATHGGHRRLCGDRGTAACAGRCRDVGEGQAQPVKYAPLSTVVALEAKARTLAAQVNTASKKISTFTAQMTSAANEIKDLQTQIISLNEGSGQTSAEAAQPVPPARPDQPARPDRRVPRGSQGDQEFRAPREVMGIPARPVPSAPPARRARREASVHRDGCDQHARCRRHGNRHSAERPGRTGLDLLPGRFVGDRRGGQITDQEAGYVVGSGPELNGTTPVGWTIYYYPYVTNNVPYEIHVECIS